MTKRRGINTQIFCLALLISVFATWLAAASVGRPLTGIDDANIFFKYAENLSNGHGFVYNIEGERVEGFTSLLWVLVCAACFRCSASPEWLLLGINVALLAFAIQYLSAFLASWGNSRQKNDHEELKRQLICLAISAVWLVLNPKFVIWSTITLMDIGIWSAVFLFGTVQAARHCVNPQRKNSVGLSVAGCLMLLVRPEGMLIVPTWFFATVLGRVIQRPPSMSRAASVTLALKSLFIPVLTYVLVLGGLFAFRMTYFGFPFPNTFYAKVSPDRFYNLKLGLGYLVGYLRSQPVIGISAVGVLVAGVRTLIGLFQADGPRSDGDRIERGLETTVCLTAGVSLIIPVLTGGDHFAMYRFYQPFWPVLLLPIHCLRPKYSKRQRAGGRAASRSVAVAILAAASVSIIYLSQFPRYDQIDSRVRVEFDYARGGRLLGATLNQTLPHNPPTSIGVLTAGGVAFAYQDPVIDLLGLNNVRMGHSPGDRRGNKNHAAFHLETFFELAPDLVNPRLVRRQDKIPKIAEDLLPEAGSFWDSSTLGLFRSSRFRANYSAIFVANDEQDEVVSGIKGWATAELIDRLRSSGRRATVLK